MFVDVLIHHWYHLRTGSSFRYNTVGLEIGTRPDRPRFSHSDSWQSESYLNHVTRCFEDPTYL